MEEEKGVLDLVIEVLGSLLGVQDCSRLVACRSVGSALVSACALCP